MKTIKIGNTKYIVSEDLGFVQSAGFRSAFVVVAGLERVAVKRGGVWSFRDYAEKIDRKAD